LDKALAVDPGSAYALMLQEGSDGKKATAAHPTDWRAWLVSADRNDGDRKDLEQAMSLAPNDAGVLVRLAYAEQRVGESAHALAHATQAASLSPGRSDVLDGLAHIYAANGRCDEARNTEQRAIDAMPDAASSHVPAELKKRMVTIMEHCVAVSSGSVIESKVRGQVTLKSCKKPMPQLSARVDLQVDFTLDEGGKVNAVKVSGESTAAVRAAVQRYLESCTYEPVVVDGKPRAVQTTARFRTEAN